MSFWTMQPGTYYTNSFGTLSGSALPKPISTQPLTAVKPVSLSPTAPASATTTATSPAAPPTEQDQLAGLSGDQRNAYVALQSILNLNGLGSLAKPLLDYAQQGYDSATAQYLLEQTPEWKQRFAGNEMLKQKGLAELDPGTYLATEAAMDAAFRANGLGYLASHDQFAKLIGNNVSPKELSERIGLATQYTVSQDPSLLQALKQFHGLDVNHIVGYVLDPQRSLPFLQQLSNSTAIGAEAIRQGLGSDAGLGARLERYASEGLTQNQAANGFSQIAGFLPREQQLASVYGTGPYTQATAEADVLEGMASAQRARLRLNDLEAANFSGSSGGTARSYTQSTQGLF